MKGGGGEGKSLQEWGGWTGKGGGDRAHKFGLSGYPFLRPCGQRRCLLWGSSREFLEGKERSQDGGALFWGVFGGSMAGGGCIKEILYSARRRGKEGWWGKPLLVVVSRFRRRHLIRPLFFPSLLLLFPWSWFFAPPSPIIPYHSAKNFFCPKGVYYSIWSCRCTELCETARNVANPDPGRQVADFSGRTNRGWTNVAVKKPHQSVQPTTLFLSSRPVSVYGLFIPFPSPRPKQAAQPLWRRRKRRKEKPAFFGVSDFATHTRLRSLTRMPRLVKAKREASLPCINITEIRQGHWLFLLLCQY